MAWENLPSTNTPLNATNMNKIVESGSNANGNYIKYQDGTMECWHVIVGNQFNCTDAQSNGYFFKDTNNSAENTKIWTFPQQFYSTDKLETNVNVSSSAYTMASVGTLTASSCAYFCCLPYPVQNVTFKWHLRAIGRWKA